MLVVSEQPAFLNKIYKESNGIGPMSRCDDRDAVKLNKVLEYWKISLEYCN